MTLPRVAACFGALSAFAACHSNSNAVDAVCWPLPASPGGSVVAGTGDVTYEPMPSMLPINTAAQSTPFVDILPRMTGFPPGSSDDEPTTPKTRVQIAIDGTSLVLGNACPAIIHYVAAADDPGAYDLFHAIRVSFGTTPLDQVEGKTAHITVQVVGSNDLTAQDEKTVTLVAPGAQDAGVSDAP